MLTLIYGVILMIMSAIIYTFCYAVHEHKQAVRNMMGFYGNSSLMRHEYNIGVGGPKSFRGYSAKLDDK